MKQQLLPKSLAEKIPALYEQDGKGIQSVAHVKLFHAYGGGTWLICEIDSDHDLCFGYVFGLVPGGDEFGYFSVSELAGLCAHINGKRIEGLQAIERDIHFKPTPLCDIQEVKRSLEARGW